jgi:hypothetical protein
MPSLLDRLDQAQGPALSDRLDAAAGADTAEAERIRRKAMGAKPLAPEEREFVRGHAQSMDPETAKGVLREAALFVLPGAGIAAGGRMAASALPRLRKMLGFDRRRELYTRSFVKQKFKADEARKAANDSKDPFSAATSDVASRQAQGLADKYGAELARLLTRESRFVNRSTATAQAAGGALGGAGAALGINAADPDDPESVGVNAVLGAAGVPLVRGTEAAVKWISRLATGIPSTAARANVLAFERQVARAREAGRRARDPDAGPATELLLHDADDLSLDFMLRKFMPQTEVNLSSVAGDRLGGTIGSLRLPPELMHAGTGGAIGFLLAPFDQGVSAIGGMMAGYFVTPKVKQKIVQHAMKSKDFRDYITTIVPRQTNVPEIATTLSLIATKEGVGEVSDALNEMAGDIVRLGNELADHLATSIPEMTEEMGRELERLRFSPISPAEGATLPAQPDAAAGQPGLPPGSRRLEPDPDARSLGAERERVRRALPPANPDLDAILEQFPPTRRPTRRLDRGE